MPRSVCSRSLLYHPICMHGAAPQLGHGRRPGRSTQYHYYLRRSAHRHQWCVYEDMHRTGDLLTSAPGLPPQVVCMPLPPRTTKLQCRYASIHLFVVVCCVTSQKNSSYRRKHKTSTPPSVVHANLEGVSRSGHDCIAPILLYHATQFILMSVS
jgi:hypothetical protein